MFFNKKTITSSQFNRDLLWPFLDILNQDCSNEIFNEIKRKNIKVNKDRTDVEIEIGIWIFHIYGKTLGHFKIFGESFSPTAINSSLDIFNYYYDRWGKKEESSKFIYRVKTITNKKVPIYQKFELAYAQKELMTEDFEAFVIATLLEIKDKDITPSLVNTTEELHKGVTVMIWQFLKEISGKYKVVDSEINMDLFKD